LPLIGNGDVFSWTDYEEHMSSGQGLTLVHVSDQPETFLRHNTP